MATTKTSTDAGSKNWLKERAAISAAHRRQKTDPAVARLIEKADQLHKERTQRNLREDLTEDLIEDDDEVNDEVPEPAPIPEADEDDIDEIVGDVPLPEEIVVKVPPKTSTDLQEEVSIQPKHGRETTEDVYRSFAESLLEQGLTTEASLELSFDLKPEDIKALEVDEDEDEYEEEEEEGENEVEVDEDEVKVGVDEVEKEKGKEVEKEREVEVEKEREVEVEREDEVVENNVKEIVDEVSKIEDSDDGFEHIEKEESKESEST
ncbi:hypothetical protein Glove_585g53 [Diversispora epigaea]|uniref:Uncharacterized protein n=1 Tax=Diversispora epigaea TaxID=1348612 RepID=A0A397GB88_9GLOM|nr:hypothetical protein Glove_585g53 [Diversispora epigaea]